MKKAAVIALMLGLFLNAFGFAEDGQAPYAASTPIEAVVSDPVFGDYGRLLFPVDADYWSGDTLGDLSERVRDESVGHPAEDRSRERADPTGG